MDESLITAGGNYGLGVRMDQGLSRIMIRYWMTLEFRHIGTNNHPQIDLDLPKVSCRPSVVFLAEA